MQLDVKRISHLKQAPRRKRISQTNCVMLFLGMYRALLTQIVNLTCTVSSKLGLLSRSFNALNYMSEAINPLSSV